MKCVTYWYQFFARCEELVPIFHGVKFATCKICGSTEHLLSVTIFIMHVRILRNGRYADADDTLYLNLNELMNEFRESQNRTITRTLYWARGYNECTKITCRIK